MYKKNIRAIPGIFKVLFVFLIISLLVALITFLKNIIQNQPFNTYVLVPAVCIICIAVMRGIVGPPHRGHIQGKTVPKKIKILDIEYRAGEPFEDDPITA